MKGFKNVQVFGAGTTIRAMIDGEVFVIDFHSLDSEFHKNLEVEYLGVGHIYSLDNRIISSPQSKDNCHFWRKIQTNSH